MKYATAVVALAATGAYAQIEVINGVLKDVSSGIDSLGSAAQGFNGNVDAVKTKADDLVSTLKKGTATVSGSADLDLSGAVGLTEPVSGLTKKAQALADGFKARKPQVEKAGACGTVRSELTDINSNSRVLIEAVKGKVPDDVKQIAEQLAGGLTKVLEQAQSDFSEQSCVNSASAGSSSAAAPSASSSAAAHSSSAAASPSSSVAASSHPATTPSSHSAPASKTSDAAATSAVHATSSVHATTAGTTLLPVHTNAPSNGSSPAHPPPVTAGAAFLAPAGAIVMAIAAAIL